MSETAVAGRRVNGAIAELLGGNSIQQLSVELTVDPKKEVLDVAGAIVEVDRPADEIERLASVVERVSGINRSLGDRLTVSTHSLADLRAENQRLADAALMEQKEQEQKTFWTNIAINVSKIIAIVVALILLRGAVRLIGTKVGA